MTLYGHSRYKLTGLQLSDQMITRSRVLLNSCRGDTFRPERNWRPPFLIERFHRTLTTKEHMPIVISVLRNARDRLYASIGETLFSRIQDSFSKSPPLTEAFVVQHAAKLFAAVLILAHATPAAFADTKDDIVKPTPRPQYLLETREFAEKRRFKSRMKQRREKFLDTIKFHNGNALAAIRRCDPAFYDGVIVAVNKSKADMRRWRRSQERDYTVEIVKLKEQEVILKKKHDGLVKQLDSVSIYEKATSDKYTKLRRLTEDARIKWENVEINIEIAQFKYNRLQNMIWLSLILDVRIHPFPKDCTVARLSKPARRVLDAKGMGKLFKLPVTLEHLRECGYYTKETRKLAFRNPKGLGTFGWQWLGIATPCPRLSGGLVVDFKKYCEKGPRKLLVWHSNGIPYCVTDARNLLGIPPAGVPGLNGSPISFLCRSAYYDEIGSPNSSKTDKNPDKILSIVKYVPGKPKVECFYLKNEYLKNLQEKDP